MKVKWSGIGMVDGRGKINGSVASKNRSGAYVRTKVTPVNRQTLAQQSVRSSFATVSSLWRGLTDVNRASWNEAVNNWQKTDIFGDLKTPSGFQLFMRLCTPLQNAFNDVIIQLYAPTPVEMPAISEVTATVDNTAGTFALATTVANESAIDLDQFVYNVYATAPQSAGKSFLKNEYRLLGWVEADASTRDIMALYTAKFGEPQLDANIGVRIQALSRATGQLGVAHDVNVNFM